VPKFNPKNKFKKNLKRNLKRKNPDTERSPAEYEKYRKPN
jgi:hypothetical protein